MSRKRSSGGGSEKRMAARKRLSRLVPGAALLGAFIIVLLFALRPRPVWFVDRGFESTWKTFLETADPPPPFTRVLVYDRKTPMSRWNYGFVITRDLDIVEETGGRGERVGALALIPHLYENREYRGAMPLALNPWMVFRKNADPMLSLARVTNPSGGAGTLILPGAEREAVNAWQAQLLQERPGIFPESPETWEAGEEQLFRGRRFQVGALTYSWFDVWILLLKDGPSWVYAPLSRVRKELDVYQAGLLDATRFPIPDDWNEYGLQADVLWALPRGKGRKKVTDRANNWLAQAGVQTKIADILGWIPAHPAGRPYDTIAREAQVAWFSSSFIWQGINSITNEGN